MSDTAVVPFSERIGALTAGDVRSQVNLIQEIMTGVMKVNEHFGVIPGTGTKPSLLKAGAEKLCLTFRLDPQYEITERRDGQHLTIMSKCILYHIPTGQRFGSGMGSCSTMESKYAYRNASRSCPSCGSNAIIKGKEEYGGGWVCFKKKGGCGAKFGDGDERIESQPQGRIPNEDLPDQYNTVLKMANKRSLVAAVLNATAASDIFTQDIEDMPQFAAEPAPAAPANDRAPVEQPAAKSEGEAIDHETGEVIPSKDPDRKLTPGELANIKKKMEAKKITEADIKMKWGVILDELTKTDFKPITDWIKAAP